MTGHTEALKAKRATLQGRPFVCTLTGPKRARGRRKSRGRARPGQGDALPAGTNEDTNGLFRQYMPKGTDLSVYTAEALERIERSHNSRPRKALGFMTPSPSVRAASSGTTNENVP